MFTGIIRHTGDASLDEGRNGAGDRRLRVCTDPDCLGAIEAGASVAVDGACLTATAVGECVEFDVSDETMSRTTIGECVEFDVSDETMSRTTIGEWRPGRRVNLECAMRVGDEVGGHFVSGHVDAVCKVAAIDAEGGGHRVRFDLPTVCAAHVCYKGSVCVNGVSLTVNRADAESFEVNLIPYTLEHTNLGDLAVGQSVNLEVDLLSRYLHRLMSRAGAA